MLNGIKIITNMINKKKDLKLAIIGLGYVGLPLALEFSKKRKVVGFDINKNRIKQLKLGIDKNLDFSKTDLKNKYNLDLTSNINNLKFANCYIIAVPTPVNESKKPDLRLLFKASQMIGKILKKGDLIIYESTVYPGCVEEDCVPILQKFSKLRFNKDFYCGYSPERINPGDKFHTISNIKKITSGSTYDVSDVVDKLYNEIITVGTYKAESIKIAEAAKVIENTQRDLNIALINELSILFRKMNIDTQAVLDAAKSKWNFLPFKPGLVGGHCIGVDPYYLTYKAKKVGYKPKIILAGRKINDNMGTYVASELLKKLKKKNIEVKNAKILIMGLTFKENCADVRNSGIKKVILKLSRYRCKIDLFDPWVDSKEIKKIYKILPNSKLKKNNYDAIIIAVAHEKFKKMGIKNILNLCKKNNVVYDLKNLFKSNQVSMRL